MSVSSPLFIALLYALSFLTAYALSKSTNIVNESGRYESIDGLRGLLALAVYFHHSVIWYGFIKTDIWQTPATNLVRQLGQTSVAFFFMITSFLFVFKLINTDNFSWINFLISRIFRLVPLYYIVILLITLICFAAQGFILKQEYSSFFKSIMPWLVFNIIYSNDINSFKLTDIIIAKVAWTLIYEWWFYCTLPVIAVVLLKNIKIPAVLFSIIFISIFFKYNVLKYHLALSFLSGGLAAVIVKINNNKINFKNNYISLFLAVLFACIPLFSSTENVYCVILLFIIFTLIALGNNLFGILKVSFLKFLGEICYSTYLIHGIVLFVWFYFVIGYKNAKNLSEPTYMLNIAMITPIVVILSYFSFRLFEKPFMNFSQRLRRK